MPTELKLEPRKLQAGSGIYEVGNDCFLKLFVTDGGRALPVNHRIITEDDLLLAYSWGRLEERESASGPKPDQESQEKELEDIPF